MAEPIQMKFKIDTFLMMIFHIKPKTKFWKIGLSSFKFLKLIFQTFLESSHIFLIK